MESIAPEDGRAPRKHTRGAKIFFWFNTTVWSGCVAVAVWKTLPWQYSSAFAVCLGMWGLFRLAAEIAIYRVEKISVATTDRREEIAGWLFIAKPAANGAFFTSVGALAVAPWQRPAAIVGAVVLPIGLASLILGLWLLHGWRRKRIAAQHLG